MTEREHRFVESGGKTYCRGCFGQVSPPGKVGCVCGFENKMMAMMPVLVAFVIAFVVVAVAVSR
jgi:hypothetical protein